MVSKIKAGCRFYLLPLEDHGHELLVIPAKTYKKKGIRFHFFSHISGESSLFHKNDTGNSTLSALEVPSGDGDSDCKLVWTDSWETLCHFLRNEYGGKQRWNLVVFPTTKCGTIMVDNVFSINYANFSGSIPLLEKGTPNNNQSLPRCNCKIKRKQLKQLACAQ